MVDPGECAQVCVYLVGHCNASVTWMLFPSSKLNMVSLRPVA